MFASFSSIQGSGEFGVLGPLETKPVKISNDTTVSVHKYPYCFHFESGKEIRVEPISKSLLFTPPERSVIIGGKLMF